MKAASIIRSLLVLLSLLLALAPRSAHPVAAAGPPTFSPPKQFYLALGDSLAFGYQQVKVNAEFPNVDPATFTTGYVDDFARMLAAVHPSIRTVNYGCPGATTTTFRAEGAGCTTYPFPLHNSFSGTQLDAAVAFIRAHPNQVNPITLDIGANDLLGLIEGCGATPDPASCVSRGLPTVLETVSGNLSATLAALRAAAPHSEIIVMQYYNPLAALDPATNDVVIAGNRVITAAASAQQALLADAFPAFNVAPPQPQTLCTRSFICTVGDIHPTDAGYQEIAGLFWAASGYGRLGS